ncbi:SDR family oxidoreductase [Leucobacter sp. UCMA 4100]|uniref:SDR family NAD(P)-dependent oxidoreductase n=1 Tax=Leucobacter sp. UCMA 4100 TaxID=2810534 RepID=UPI0022EADAD8|nr:SDR family oxidoreductase [Leucobacter sp. UCMA 4100]MDA3146467.1 SDR family oxidoreductase [Leucobacter sp. UCMA 4100]
MHDQSLATTSALVTGAAGGLGQAQVAQLASLGATVAAHARSESSGLAQLLEQTGATPMIADLATPEACRALIRDTAGQLGSLDLVVANHATMIMGLLVDADPADWWRVIEVNLLGTFALIQESARVMREQATGGRIIVISSEWGVTGWPEATAYAASKAGLLSLVKSLGRELGPEGIFVNAIAPGVIDTPQLAVDSDAAGISLEAMHEQYAKQIPLGRIGRPEEIAEAVAMLASPEQRSIVGQTIQVNGGATRSRV